MNPPINPLTHPTTHTPTSTNHKSSNRIELSRLGQDLINFSRLTWPHPLTHWPNQPPTYPPMGGGVSTNHKSSNRIELSWLVEVLLNFYWFWGSPGGWWVGRLGGGGCECVGVLPLLCTHIHACTHTHTHMYVKHDKHGCLHVGGHLQFLYMYTCVHVHACTCEWTYVGIPPCPHTSPTHLPPSQSCREPKTPKFNKSWTNQDISILFEDSLPLNIPKLI